MGCTTNPSNPTPIEWVEMSQSELERFCGKAIIGTTTGCYRWQGGICYMYTRALKNETDRQTKLAVGEETIHCVKGNFHLSMSY
jgi:hypothetical protein